MSKKLRITVTFFFSFGIISAFAGNILPGYDFPYSRQMIIDNKEIHWLCVEEDPPYVESGNYRSVFPGHLHYCGFKVSSSVHPPVDRSKGYADSYVEWYTQSMNRSLVDPPVEDLYSVDMSWNTMHSASMYSFLIDVTFYRPRLLLGRTLYYSVPAWHLKSILIFPTYNYDCNAYGKVDILKNTYLLEFYSYYLTNAQMRRIAFGIKERLILAESSDRIYLTALYSIRASCRPVINETVMSFNGVTSFLGSYMVHRCATEYQVELFEFLIPRNRVFSGVYGMRCTGWKQHHGLIVPENSEISVHVVFGDYPDVQPSIDTDAEEDVDSDVNNQDLEMKAMLNGSHFIIPSQNTSAFFDVLVKPPTAQVSFHKLKEPTESNSFVISVITKGHVRIAFYRIKINISGDYQLEARDGPNVASEVVQITVARKLVLHTTPPRRAVAQGVPADLVCTVSGWPLPNVQWSTAIGPINPSKDITVTTRVTVDQMVEAVLHFASPEFEDSSYYYCSAWNEVDSDTSEVIFDVYPIGSGFVDKGFGTQESTAADSDQMDDEDYVLDLFPQGDPEQEETKASPHPGVIVVSALSSIILTCVGLAVVAIVLRCLLRKRRMRRIQPKKRNISSSKTSFHSQESTSSYNSRNTASKSTSDLLLNESF